jgi:hypothetical protein
MRNQESIKKFKGTLMLLEKEVNSLWGMFYGGHNANSEEVYKAARILSERVNSFISFLEDQDENMKIGTLESVDTYFDSYVNDLVNSKIDYLQGKISAEEASERMSAAARKMESSIREVAEEVQPIEEITIDSFVHDIAEEMGFSDTEANYKREFEKSLLQAVKLLQERRGTSDFFVTVNGKNLKGSISIEQAMVIIEFEGVKYKFTECNGPCKEDDENCVCYNDDFDEDEEDMCAPDCECADYNKYEPAEVAEYEEDFKDTYNYVRVLEGDATEQINTAMDTIEEYLEGVTSFEPEEIELIRFYLRNLPFNSAADVEALDDSAVILVWKQRLYTQGKL